MDVTGKRILDGCASCIGVDAGEAFTCWRPGGWNLVSRNKPMGAGRIRVVEMPYDGGWTIEFMPAVWAKNCAPSWSHRAL